jgi:hypothetical protein
LSSAILYVAIVVIWAGVLIPRWIRRDSSSSEQVSDDATVTVAPPEQERPAAARQRDDAAAARQRDDAAAARRKSRPEVRQGQARPARSEGSRAEDARAEDARAESARADSGADLEHARVLSARRRLLGLLVVLSIGSGALAVTRMAAWWVIVPPSVMLLGYLALLREAAGADAERRERARARAREAAREARPVAPAAPAAPPALARDAEIIKLTAGQGGEKFYDQYEDAKLRAVGDLARAEPLSSRGAA